MALTNRTPRTSTPRTALEETAWPRLDADMIETFRRHGRELTLGGGEVMFEVAEQSYDFIYVEEGSLDIVDRAEDRVVVHIEAGNFVGELGMLMGQKTFFAGIAGSASRVIVVPLRTLRDLIATVPEIADVIVTAFAARRRLLMEWGEGGLVILGTDGDAAALRLREFAGRSKTPYRWIDRHDEAAVNELASHCELPPKGVAAVIGRSRVLVSPSPRELALAMGLDLGADVAEPFDVVVVGAGPAGLASSVYAASEGLRVLAIEDTAIGGQAGTSSRIENYLGFPKGVSGAELAYLGEVQAVKFGARLTAPRRAVQLLQTPECFTLELDDGGTVMGRAVVLANGVQYRRLPLGRLEEFEGRGVYYAATDLEARFCRNTEVVIVGGGNSAGQAAMFLSRYANCAHVVVRGEGLAATMSSYLSERIESDDRIRLWTRSEISHLDGEEALGSVTIRNRDTGDEATIGTRALFIMIGAAPKTEWLGGQVALDEKGFVLTGRDAGADVDGYATSCPGVFAVGDVRSGSIKRVASAVGEGSVVISAVHAFLEQRRHRDAAAVGNGAPEYPVGGPYLTTFVGYGRASVFLSE